MKQKLNLLSIQTRAQIPNNEISGHIHVNPKSSVEKIRFAQIPLSIEIDKTKREIHMRNV